MIAGCPAPAPPTAVVVQGDGFTVSLPLESQATGGGLSIPGARSQVVYRLPDGELVYILTLEADSGLGVTPAGFPSVRYSGVFFSDAGDQLVRGLLSDGDRILRAVRAGLANDRQLYVATDAEEPEAVFEGVNISGSDGTNLAQQLEGTSFALLAPVVATNVTSSERRLAVLADRRIFEIEDTDTAIADAWRDGDRVAVHGTSGFSIPSDSFLTRVGEWRSLAADLLGTGQSVTLAGVLEGGRQLQLSDGTFWVILLNGVQEAAGWSNGDELLRLGNVQPFFGQTIFVRLRTGRVVVAAPAN